MMVLTIKKVEKWQVSDGSVFDRKADADQWVLRQAVSDLLMNGAELSHKEASDAMDAMDLDLETVKAWVESLEIARKETKR